MADEPEQVDDFQLHVADEPERVDVDDYQLDLFHAAYAHLLPSRSITFVITAVHVMAIWFLYGFIRSYGMSTTDSCPQISGAISAVLSYLSVLIAYMLSGVAINVWDYSVHLPPGSVNEAANALLFAQDLPPTMADCDACGRRTSPYYGEWSGGLRKAVAVWILVFEAAAFGLPGVCSVPLFGPTFYYCAQAVVFGTLFGPVLYYCMRDTRAFCSAIKQ